MNRFTKSAASVLLAISALTFFSCDDDESNIIGLNDAAKYGSITVTFEGTRSDEKPFTAKKTFRFLPESNPYYSSVQYDGDAYFYLRRQLSAIDINNEGDNYADLELQADTENDVASSAGFYFNTTIIDEDDNIYFYLNDSFQVTAEDFENFNFSEGTSKLKVKFSKTLDGESNDTGNPLTVTVEVNATIFEYLDGGFQGDF